MLTGGCLCGAVRYRTSGTPLFQMICHCRDCQRASGTGGVPVMGVPRATFEVTGTTTRSAITGGSGKLAIRHFCPGCGCLLFGTPEVAPDLVTIYVGSLDDPAAFAPSAAIFTRHRPPWAQLAIGLAEHEALPR